MYIASLGRCVHSFMKITHSDPPLRKLATNLFSVRFTKFPFVTEQHPLELLEFLTCETFIPTNTTWTIQVIMGDPHTLEMFRCWWEACRRQQMEDIGKAPQSTTSFSSAPLGLTSANHPP